MTVPDVKRMQLGHVIDFVIEYNERQERAERIAERKARRPREATQADIDAFLG